MTYGIIPVIFSPRFHNSLLAVCPCCHYWSHCLSEIQENAAAKYVYSRYCEQRTSFNKVLSKLL